MHIYIHNMNSKRELILILQKGNWESATTIIIQTLLPSFKRCPFFSAVMS